MNAKYIWALVWLVAGLGVLAWSEVHAQEITEISAEDKEQLVTLINNARKKQNLTELRLNTRLAKEAQSWATKMQKNGKLESGGIKITKEQCLAEKKTPAAVFNFWMGQKENKDALLGKKYKELGLGRAGDYWVADVK